MNARNFVRILGIAAILAGYLAWNLTHRQDHPLDLAGATEIDVPPGIRLIRLNEAETRWHDPGTLFLDVRSSIDYEFGHIAGALSFPESAFEQRFPELEPRLRQAQAIVVYCKSTDCGLSLWAAIRLHNAGLKQAMIFPGGWNEWFNRGLPISRVQG